MEATRNHALANIKERIAKHLTVVNYYTVPLYYGQVVQIIKSFKKNFPKKVVINLSSSRQVNWKNIFFAKKKKRLPCSCQYDDECIPNIYLSDFNDNVAVRKLFYL